MAIKLPFIFECRAKFYALKGKIIIDSKSISIGMIRFKSRNVGVYDSNLRFTFENHGNIIFKGRGVFKSGSSVSVGPKGILTFDDAFVVGPLNKIICMNSIIFGKNILLAWEIIIMDSDFHYIYNLELNELHQNTKPIVIGDHCWIGSRAVLYKGTIIPNNTIVAGNSVLNKQYRVNEYCLLAGNPAVVKTSNIVRLINDELSTQEIDHKKKDFQRYAFNLRSTNGKQ
jgi:acetyltransferase-like isoleucine patch superfamily enzyme